MKLISDQKSYHPTERKTYNNSRDEPKTGGNEAERLGGLPTTTDIMEHAVPMEDAAAIKLVYSIDQDTECGKPCEGYDQVN